MMCIEMKEVVKAYLGTLTTFFLAYSNSVRERNQLLVTKSLFFPQQTNYY